MDIIDINELTSIIVSVECACDVFVCLFVNAAMLLFLFVCLFVTFSVYSRKNIHILLHQ